MPLIHCCIEILASRGNIQRTRTANHDKAVEILFHIFRNIIVIVKKHSYISFKKIISGKASEPENER